VWTDCGWYWYSDEPWAWACYHYGYWVYEANYGWVWVPDVVWGPAWVSWRVGGGYIGWAPLPPPGVSIHVAAPTLFVFVQTAHFTQPIRPTKVIVNNTTIIKQTTVINNIKQVNRTFDGAAPRKVVVNEGPGVGVIEKQTNRKVDAVPIQEAAQRTTAPSTIERKPMPERKLTPTDRQPPAETPGAPARKSSPPEAPAETPGPPARKSSPPDQPRQTPGHEFAPAPTPAPGPGTSPGNPAGPPDGRGKGPEKDKDKGHDKDRP